MDFPKVFNSIPNDLLNSIRSSRPEVLYKKAILKAAAKFKGKYLDDLQPY